MTIKELNKIQLILDSEKKRPSTDGLRRVAVATPLFIVLTSEMG
jgi:hypothetical protein